MFLVGLTGGIASGKSSVAECWQKLGADVIDADVIAREVVEPGSYGLKKVSEVFGQSVLNADGSLNRKALASIVFASSDSRNQLESIIHPLIRETAQRLIEHSTSAIVVYVIPLLVESKSELPFDLIVTVEAPEPDQVSRMVETRGMSQSEAVARIRSQAKPAERANLADKILNSNQSFHLLLNDATTLWYEIQRLAALKDSNGN